MIKKVGENTLWQIASKATNAATGLIIIGTIQRTYGDTGVGVYSAIISYVSFFFMPVDFGLNAIAVKHLLDKNKKSSEVFQNILALRVLLSAILIIIAWIIGANLPYNPLSKTGYSHEIKLGIFAASGAILAQGLLVTANAYFQAIEKYKLSFITNLVSALTNISLFLLLIKLMVPVNTAIISLAISGLLGGITGILLVKLKIGEIRPKFQKEYIKELVTSTLPLTITLVLNLVYFRIDSLILPFYRSIEEVGRYNIAYKIFDTILVIPNYVANALYPTLLLKHAEGRAVFSKTVGKVTASLTAIALTSSAICYIVAPLAVQAITGNQSEETIFFTRLLSAGLIFFFLTSIVSWSLIVIGKQKYLAYIYATTMAINILLNVIYIPLYGATASAIITVATEGGVLIMSAPLLLTHLKKEWK